jgi:hypothetical protein
MTHQNQTILANKTIANGVINHVGQLYFDQSLLDEVFKIAPYKDNAQQRLQNKNDINMALGTEGMADNVLNYVLLGNKLEDGVFAWMNFGIESTRDRRFLRMGSECTKMAALPVSRCHG